MAFDGLLQIVKDEDLTSATTSPLFSLGAKHHKSGNEYVYVYNDSTAALGTGKYCILNNAGGTSFTSGYSVCVTNASLAGILAGVAQNTISTAYYGFVLTKGLSYVALDSGEVSMNAGDLLALGTNGGFVVAGVTFSTAPRFGFMINSGVTTVGTGKARIFGSCL